MTKLILHGKKSLKIYQTKIWGMGERGRDILKSPTEASTRKEDREKKWLNPRSMKSINLMRQRQKREKRGDGGGKKDTNKRRG